VFNGDTKAVFSKVAVSANRSAGLGPALGFHPAVRVKCFIDFALGWFATR
jgi:hypothetical protein